MIKYSVMILLTLSSFANGVLAAQSNKEQDVAKLAARQKIEAEKSLSAFRLQQVTERNEITKRLQKAYADLNDNHKHTEKSESTLADLIIHRKQFNKDEATFRYKMKSLYRIFSSLSGKQYKKIETPENVASEVWSGLEQRLKLLNISRQIRIVNDEVICRDGLRQKIPVLHVGKVAAYACGKTENNSGILERMADKNLRISGMPLSGRDIDAMTNNGKSPRTIPVDVTGELIKQSHMTPKSWNNWLASGGIFVYPILLACLAGIALVIERIIYLVNSTPGQKDSLLMVESLKKGNINPKSSSLFQSTPEGRIVLRAEKFKGAGAEELDSEMESALLSEAPALQRSLSMLAAFAGVAPLLGLLGTVSGMIHTFSDIASFGTGNSNVLSGGISEALITTQLGLMVAAPLVLAHAWLSRSIDRRSVMLEQWAMDVINIVKKTET